MRYIHNITPNFMMVEMENHIVRKTETDEMTKKHECI